MAKSPVEREAKLEVGDDVELPDLEGVAPGVTAEAVAPQDLRAVYLDTEDRRLLAVGITLRHRTGEGSETRRWTLKLPVAGGGATIDRREIEWDRDADDPPARAVDLLSGLTRGERLVEVADITTERRRTVLTDGQGRSLAEVDDDRVTAVAEGTSARFREVEVELTGGSPKLVDAVVRRLVKAGATATPPEPKLQRVLGSASRDEATARLGSKAKVGDVGVAALESGLERWFANEPAVRLGEDPEAVHQVRVAARRLRSDIDALSELFAPSWTEPAVDSLKWAAAALGRVRDLDVLRAWIDAHGDRSSPSGRAGVEALLARADGERAEAVDALAAVLGDLRYARLLDSLVAARREPPWRGAEDGNGIDPNERAAPELRRLLHHRARQIRHHLRRVGKHPSAAELHDLRKRAKRLRYNAELARPVLGAKAARAAELAAGLQSVLGDHHDAVVAEHWLAEAATGAGADQAFAAGLLVAAARARQEEAAGRWRPFVDALDAKPVRSLLR